MLMRPPENYRLCEGNPLLKHASFKTKQTSKQWRKMYYLQVYFLSNCGSYFWSIEMSIEMFVKYASGHCCRLAENDLHNTRHIKLFDGVKHFFLWSSVNLSVCFVSNVIRQSCHSVGIMTFTNFEILFAFSWLWQLEGSLFFCQIVLNFLSLWFAISGKSCSLFYNYVTKNGSHLSRNGWMLNWNNFKNLVSSVLSLSGLQTCSQFLGDLSGNWFD